MKTITDRIRSRFVKDFSLPIPIVYPVFFEYYLDLYDDLLKTRQKYSLLDEFESEEQFFVENKELVDKVIEDVKSTELYVKLSSYVFPKSEETLPEREIYTRENVDKTFISIDMKQANFNCFLLISELLTGKTDVFHGKKSYKDYLGLFTTREYFKQSKYIRQVIFGNLNPKKQQQVQKYIMDFIVYSLRKKIDSCKFFKASADEIIIQSDNVVDKSEIKKCFDESFYNVKMFKLKQIGDKSYFVKEFDDSTIEFKCVPLHFFSQCYKYYRNLPITQTDRTFVFENNLAVFQEPLFTDDHRST